VVLLQGQPDQPPRVLGRGPQVPGVSLVERDRQTTAAPCPDGLRSAVLVARLLVERPRGVPQKADKGECFGHLLVGHV